MIFDYQCIDCDKIHEEFHGSFERPKVLCVCGGKCVKLISVPSGFIGMQGGRATYDFVDVNTTGQPVRIHNKRQWKDHLKRNGLNDDVKNDPYTKSELEQRIRDRNNSKIENKRKIKQNVTEVYKKRKTVEFKQRVKEAITQKGGK